MFAVTNVIAHGVPYAILVGVTAQRRLRSGASVAAPLRHGFACLVAALWACAWGEEWLWDRLLWHEHGGYFPGPEFDVGRWRPAVLAVLVVPQLTHYVLDGLIWRRGGHVTRG